MPHESALSCIHMPYNHHIHFSLRCLYININPIIHRLIDFIQSSSINFQNLFFLFFRCMILRSTHFPQFLFFNIFLLLNSRQFMSCLFLPLDNFNIFLLNFFLFISHSHFHLFFFPVNKSIHSHIQIILTVNNGCSHLVLCVVPSKLLINIQNIRFIRLLCSFLLLL
jgi:hypothetical protein